MLFWYYFNCFNPNKNFINSGIAYLDDFNTILIGPIGGLSLQVKCKSKDCTDSYKKVEELLSNYNG